MFQRTLRWNTVGVVFALVLILGLVAPIQAQAREPRNSWQVSVLLQAWWSGLWAHGRLTSARGDGAEAASSQGKRTSSADPNGLDVASPVLGRAIPEEPTGAH